MAPVARAIGTLATPGLDQRIAAPAAPMPSTGGAPPPSGHWWPGLSTEQCEVSGRAILVKDGQIGVLGPRTIAGAIDQSQRWSRGQLDASMGTLIEHRASTGAAG